MDKHDRNFKIIAVLTIAVFAAVIAAFFLYLKFAWNSDPRTDIESGFSDALITRLDDVYGITVPDDAEFVGGYFTNGFRDDFLILAFDVEIPSDTAASSVISDMLGNRNGNVSLHFEDVGQENWKGDLSSEFGRKYINSIELDTAFSSLYYSSPHDGVISLCLVGWRPGNAIK